MFDFLESYKNKKPYIFYLDKDEKYQFLVSEALKSECQLKLLSSEESIKVELKNVSKSIDAIIISIDDFNYHKVINDYYFIKKELPNIIFMTKKLDNIEMQSLMVNYCASNYLIKPFTRSGIKDCIKRTNKNIKFPSKRLLEKDKELFDRYYDYLKENNEMPSEAIQIDVEPISEQLQKLHKLVNVQNKKSKKNQANVLFFNDKKQSLNFYKQFVKKQDINSFFTDDLNTVRQIYTEVGIDIILVEIKELNNEKVSYFQELMDNKDQNHPDILVINSIDIDLNESNLISSGVRVLVQKPLTSRKLIQVLDQIVSLREIKQTIKEALNI